MGDQPPSTKLGDVARVGRTIWTRRRCALLPDRWPRQYGLARLHPIDIVERIPGRDNIGYARMRRVVTNEIADQGLCHAELHVAVDMRIGGVVDLRNQKL